MSLKFRSGTGVETPIAGLNGTSGELVPSVSYYQSGTKLSDTISWVPGDSGTFTVDLPKAMPDADYVVVANIDTPQINCSVVDQTATLFKVRVINNSATTYAAAIELRWQAFKLMTDENRALDEQAIADIQAVIPSGASTINQLVTKNDIYTTTAFIAANNTTTYRKVDIKLPSVAGVIQLTTKSGDVYYISKRDGTSIKFTKVVNGVGGDVVTISGYYFDTTESVLTLYLTMAAWSSVRIDVLNAWSTAGQNSAKITVTVIEQAEMAGTTPTIINTLVDTTSTGTGTMNTSVTASGAYVRWTKVGRLVTLETQGSVTGDIASSTDLATGLPQPAREVAFVAQGNNNSVAVGLVIGTGGNLRGHYVLSNGTWWHGTITYISD